MLTITKLGPRVAGSIVEDITLTLHYAKATFIQSTMTRIYLNLGVGRVIPFHHMFLSCVQRYYHMLSGEGRTSRWMMRNLEYRDKQMIQLCWWMRTWSPLLVLFEF